MQFIWGGFHSKGFTVHLRTHIGEKAFMHGKWYLGIHQWTHTGEKPYKCRQCEKAYIHTMDKLYQCSNSKNAYM